MFGTEACEGYLPWSKGPYPGDWGRAETYAHDILGDLNNFAEGWTDWNAVRSSIPVDNTRHDTRFKQLELA